MSTPQSEEQLKAHECAERQEEMDAIAAFGTRCEFPSVSGAYVQPLPPAAGGGEAESESRVVNPRQ